VKEGLTQYRPRTMRSLAIAERERAIFSARPPRSAIERLQMAQDTYHQPVLEREIVEFFTSQSAGVVVDATLGGGGHAAALLLASPQRRILGIDRDPEARAAAGLRLSPFGDRVHIVAATFATMAEVVAEQHDFVADQSVVGILMDLGVSSHQLDESSRGFSFRADAPLDMRMDPTQGVTAAQYLATADLHDFVRLLRANGEDRFAGAIARSVLERQPQTTSDLTDAVERAVPMAARRRGHVATRVFQALRIVVNDEQNELEIGLEAAISLLAPGGLLAVISYHSGEDRAVKFALHEAATGGCHCPYELGCVCGAVPRVVITRASAQLATAREVEVNPRARSARLRTATKVAS
jgi:16S rRNA (cytosine1402-N4)-methyltransferase